MTPRPAARHDWPAEGRAAHALEHARALAALHLLDRLQVAQTKIVPWLAQVAGQLWL